MLFEGVKVYFCTARDKDFYAQLMRDGNVAVTGMNREYQMIRLSGKAHRLMIRSCGSTGYLRRIHL